MPGEVPAGRQASISASDNRGAFRLRPTPSPGMSAAVWLLLSHLAASLRSRHRASPLASSASGWRPNGAGGCSQVGPSGALDVQEPSEGPHGAPGMGAASRRPADRGRGRGQRHAAPAAPGSQPAQGLSHTGAAQAYSCCPQGPWHLGAPRAPQRHPSRWDRGGETPLPSQTQQPLPAPPIPLLLPEAAPKGRVQEQTANSGSCRLQLCARDRGTSGREGSSPT